MTDFAPIVVLIFLIFMYWWIKRRSLVYAFVTLQLNLCHIVQQLFSVPCSGLMFWKTGAHDVSVLPHICARAALVYGALWLAARRLRLGRAGGGYCPMPCRQELPTLCIVGKMGVAHLTTKIKYKCALGYLQLPPDTQTRGGAVTAKGIRPAQVAYLMIYPPTISP